MTRDLSSLSSGTAKSCACMLWLFLLLLTLTTYDTALGFESAELKPCFPLLRLRGPYAEGIADNSSVHTFIIGDIHGDIRGFKEILSASGIIKSGSDECLWHADMGKRRLIQTGDILDRGANTSEVWKCLNSLQASMPNDGSEFIRILGNHELLWLEGVTEYRHQVSDTKMNIATVVSGLKNAVLAGRIVGGAYAFQVAGIPILASHAGLQPVMISSLLKQAIPGGYKNYDKDANSFKELSSTEQIDLLADQINSIVKKNVQDCQNHLRCTFENAIYMAGPERGGAPGSVGGPFWTGFEVMEAVDRSPESPSPFVQVVGHTIKMNRVRSTLNLGSICVDVGMYEGGRGYLEILPSGRFIAHSKKKNGNIGVWEQLDLSSAVCAL